ncbi:MAG: peptidoglycan peptidase [Paracoccus sp. (in: a-proteobacteria)]|uniref:peptidoglycan peptidase n=1 Tax=Paracoccus sp. TaxID=267 RepID=UPI0026DFFA1E|nr:peptidoglycan peptidase [Paracoccus sp. (in: a-proteobacteria)]MDO5612540.1 peptidoglycan peptidase [Paracoccus sp. (in: a-proteobacteria)]
MKRTLLAACVVIAWYAPALAQDDNSLAGPEPGSSDYSAGVEEAAWDWLPGDLVFRNGLNSFDDLVRDAESGEWASVAVLRPSSGGPVAIYVDEQIGVTETPLDYFINGVPYAVFRVTGMDASLTNSYDSGPMATFAGIVAMEMPYDADMMLENGKFYNAELPFAAAMNAGVVLASPKPLRDLATMETPLGQALLKGRIGHYPCIEATDDEMCWGWMRNLAIVTPEMIVSSDAVKQVYP